MMEERTLKSKMLLLQDDLVAGRVSSAFNRVSQVAGYGYQPEVGRLSRLLKNYKDNGGIPDLLFDAGLSVNYNLLTNTSFDSNILLWNQYVNGGTGTNPVLSWDNGELKIEPQGTYTHSGVSQGGIAVIAGARYIITGTARGTLASWNLSIFFSGGLGASTNITMDNTTKSFTFAYDNSTAGTGIIYFRTNTAGLAAFWIDNLQFTQVTTGSSTPLPYRPRADATAVKPLNLGTLGASGDGTYVNGTNANMLSSDVTAGLVLNFNSVLNQQITTTYSTFSQMNSGVHIGFWKKSPTNANARIMTNSNFDANSRIEINEFGGFVRFRIMSSSTAYYQAEGSGGNAFTPNVWERWDFVWNGTLSAASLIVYRNGVALATTNTTVGSPTAITDGGTLAIGANVNGSNPYSGVLDKALFEIGSKNATQIANIFNSQKSQYGY
jgi:hypothetical protein